MYRLIGPSKDDLQRKSWNLLFGTIFTALTSSEERDTVIVGVYLFMYVTKLD
jgi:hypothetical protein